MDAFPILLFFFSLSLIITASTAIDTINLTQPIRDGESIVSADGTFELGFFSPGNSKSRYVGIWYAQIPVKTYVWVANRETPVNGSSGVLQMNDNGTLAILNQNGSMVWSSNTSRLVRNPVAQLLDSGNLIVKNEGDSNIAVNYLWQSFDYPGDTMLAGMKAGKNLKTGIDWYFSSWTSLDDPSPGRFLTRLDVGGYPEFFVRQDLQKKFRLGPWNGVRFSGLPQSGPTPLFSTVFVVANDEIYWSFELNTSMPLRVTLNYDGSMRNYQWIDRIQSWQPFQSSHIDDCDNYNQCGAYSSCDVNTAPLCNCLQGFMPRNKPELDAIGWSDGCVRKISLNCSTDGFRMFTGLKLPETTTSWYNISMNLQECEYTCKNNCTCTAYANLDVRNGGSGCLLWFDDLIDLRQFTENGQEIYIRMAAAELENGGNSHSSQKRRIWIIIVCVLVTGMTLIGITLLLIVRRKRHRGKMTTVFETSTNNNGLQEDLELPLFDFDTLASATKDFSNSNVLGQGGFGNVYKGQLKDGQEIAVKRLSKSSTQGLPEFKNEVMYIAKLQHRNLVRLLGCCIEADEKMLIYEFMPNKSLDFYIFDEKQSKLLDWPTRCNIINGIARGILYLHQDSRLKIIHRDLKASNVLLDCEMNPKISDFGLARSFGVNESHANTNKVVGTYGYMSPEYAIDGHYSTKSDVFSYGVMVLEIISGKRNRGFRHIDHNLNLLGHAWVLYQEGRYSELIAESMMETCNISELLRITQIGLLCVQRSPEDRPSMLSVIVMLSGEGVLPQPKQPGFFNEREITEDTSSSCSNQMNRSGKELTITLLDAR